MPDQCRTLLYTYKVPKDDTKLFLKADLLNKKDSYVTVLWQTKFTVFTLLYYVAHIFQINYTFNGIKSSMEVIIEDLYIKRRGAEGLIKNMNTQAFNHWMFVPIGICSFL